MGQNYFNSLPFRRQLQELATCRFMDAEEFSNGCHYAMGKKIVIVGCGAQGGSLLPGLNARQRTGCLSSPCARKPSSRNVNHGKMPLTTALLSVPMKKCCRLPILS